MAALLAGPPWQYDPWCSDGTTPRDVGVEFRGKLRRRERKLVDLWASPHQDADRWHFAELKVAIRTGNHGKQIRDWRTDFDKLLRMDRRYREQRVSSLISVLFGVRYNTAKQFDDDIERLCPKLVMAPWARTIDAGPGPIFMRALIAKPGV
jgi:hypothetical protein